jgi:hypothetical protein
MPNAKCRIGGCERCERCEGVKVRDGAIVSDFWLLN